MQNLKNEIYHYFERLFEAPFFKGAFSIIAAALVTLFGEFDQVAKCFMIALIADTGTGILKGIVQRKFKSRFMRKATSKLISYGLTIIFAHFAEQFGIAGARAFALSLLGLTELKSTIENFKDIGVEFPGLVDTLLNEIERYKEKFKHFKMK